LLQADVGALLERQGELSADLPHGKVLVPRIMLHDFMKEM
jgi:hypothetical protein